MTNGHYDIIIIGTGAGGGTLARKLAPSGKKILILERGDYVKRETDNWNPARVNIEAKLQHEGSLVRPRRQTSPPAHKLQRRREHEILWSALSACEKKISVRSNISMECRLRGRSPTEKWSRSTHRPSRCITFTERGAKIHRALVEFAVSASGRQPRVADPTSCR